METTIHPPSVSTQPTHRNTAKQTTNVCRLCGANKACMPGLFAATDLNNFDGVVLGRQRVLRNADLYRERDILGMLYSVRFGQFKLTRRNAVGDHYVAQFYMAGDLIGLDAIATGRHGFRLTALENSEVCEISFAAITRTMAAEPKVLALFLQTMSIALNEQANHSLVLARPSLDERFASFLLQLSAKYERLGYSRKTFRLSMSRGDIGSYLGTSVESVSRLISRFNTQGSVLITGRMVEILDHEALVSMLAPDV